jgi:hypothetical protein
MSDHSAPTWNVPFSKMQRQTLLYITIPSTKINGSHLQNPPSHTPQIRNKNNIWREKFQFFSCFVRGAIIISSFKGRMNSDLQYLHFSRSATNTRPWARINVIGIPIWKSTERIRIHSSPEFQQNQSCPHYIHISRPRLILQLHFNRYMSIKNKNA